MKVRMIRSSEVSTGLSLVDDKVLLVCPVLSAHSLRGSADVSHLRCSNTTGLVRALRPNHFDDLPGHYCITLRLHEHTASSCLLCSRHVDYQPR